MSRAVVALAFGLVASVSALVGMLWGGGGMAPGPAHSFAEIVERLNPAVVHVTVVEGPHAAAQVEEDSEDDDSSAGPRRGEGSGFIVDPRGYILTNHHLVVSPVRIRVRLADKRELHARLVGSDPNTDLALIKVDAEELPVIPLGNSDQLRVGDWVCAIGNPLTFDHTVTVGVVSSKGRKIWDASFDAYIQTDAAINPGNSGGPLLNMAGEAVGINAAVSTEGQGIGFAIPINVARDILEQLRTKGHVSRGYLGVQLQELDPDLEKLLGLHQPNGALVLDVVKGSSGDTAGLKRYDVITAVSGQKIQDGDHLIHSISAKPPGSPVTLSVLRDGREVAIQARLTERAESPEAVGLVSEKGPPGGDVLGLVVKELGRKMRGELRIPADRAGVVIREVVGLSPGIDPLAHGDLIVEVNRKPTPDLASYRHALAALKPGDVALLFVYRPRPESTLLVKAEVEGKP
jgi:Do/DeqQ family serine protease